MLEGLHIWNLRALSFVLNCFDEYESGNGESVCAMSYEAMSKEVSASLFGRQDFR